MLRELKRLGRGQLHSSLRPDPRRVVIILPQHAKLCAICRAVSNARGDVCPVCTNSGTLLSLSRLFPSTRDGRVEYFVAS